MIYIYYGLKFKIQIVYPIFKIKFFQSFRDSKLLLRIFNKILILNESFSYLFYLIDKYYLNREIFTVNFQKKKNDNFNIYLSI